MLAKTILAIAGLAASVSAILVNTPAKGAKLDLSEKNTITWTSVSTDPSTFTLLLVDQTTMDETVIDKSVTTSDDKYTLTNVDASAGSSYKFNFVSNDAKNSGILAQSETFEIVESDKAETSSSSATAASTASGTATSTGSSKATGTATGEESSATAESSATTMKTVSSTKTSTASSNASSTANASSDASAAAVTGNAAVTLDRSFAVGGGLLAGLLMLL